MFFLAIDIDIQQREILLHIYNSSDDTNVTFRLPSTFITELYATLIVNNFFQ